MTVLFPSNDKYQLINDRFYQSMLFISLKNFSFDLILSADKRRRRRDADDDDDDDDDDDSEGNLISLITSFLSSNNKYKLFNFIFKLFFFCR